VINNKTVIIFTTYRSGSTALGQLIGKNIRRIQPIPELLNPHDEDKIPVAQTILSSGQYVVTSIMPDHLKDYFDSFLYGLDTYNIKLTRKDQIARIVSLYVAVKLNKFQFFKKETIDPYTLPIDLELIDDQINLVKELDRLAEQTDIKYDATIDYEDIKPLLNTTSIRQFIKPDNWDELYSIVKKRYYI